MWNAPEPAPFAPSVPELAMPRPRLDDDGQTVTLDLHGARVAQALDLALAAAERASERGRRTLRLVHGLSTSEAGAGRTIRAGLYDAWDAGDFDRWAVDAVRMEGVLVLSLDPAPSPLAGRLRLADL